MGIMSMAFSEAMEACATCNNGKGADGKVINGYDGKHDPKAIKDTKLTYSDGEGTPDTIMIDGPLSEFFTRGLNVKLKKQPLQPVEDSPTPEDTAEEQALKKGEEMEKVKSDMLNQHSQEQIGIATESAQIDEANLQYMVREFDEHSAEVQFLANKYDFLTPEQLPKNIKCQATVITLTDFMTPSKICEILDSAENARHQRILVVVSDALGRASGQTTQQRLVDISYTGGEYANLKNNESFNAAVESHFEPIGMKVVIGIEGFFAHLEDMYHGRA